MAIVNYYTGKRASGTELTDLVGTNNGTLEGASLPTINANGYLTFVGQHGSTAGDYNRVVFTRTSFQYGASDSFSIMVLFRYTDTLSQTNYVISVKNYTIDGAFAIYYYSSYSKPYGLMTDVYSQGSSLIGDCGSISVGTWYLYILIKKVGDYQLFKNSIAGTYYTNSFIGNLYSTNSKAVMGALWKAAASNYIYDAPSDVVVMANFNHAFSNAEVSNYNSYFKGFF